MKATNMQAVVGIGGCYYAEGRAAGRTGGCVFVVQFLFPK